MSPTTLTDGGPECAGSTCSIRLDKQTSGWHWRPCTCACILARPLVALDSSRAARAPHQLPPGRHGLARSFVARNQRERILAAVAQVASTRGYGAMSVQDVESEAG